MACHRFVKDARRSIDVTKRRQAVALQKGRLAFFLELRVLVGLPVVDESTILRPVRTVQDNFRVLMNQRRMTTLAIRARWLCGSAPGAAPFCGGRIVP